MLHRGITSPLGLLLLAAAVLKLYGTNVSAVPQFGWYSAPAVQTAAVTWGILLGIWLLSGWLLVGSWAAAVATVTAFAAVSGSMGWQGVAHCRCFGHLPASPWHAFAVDLAALVVLAAARPGREATRLETWRGVGLQLGRPALAVALLLALAAGAAHLVYGSVDLALARLRGETVSVSRGYLDFGSGRSGETRDSVIRVHNHTASPVTVIGGSSDCSCVTTQDLPAEIAPGGWIDLTIQLVLPDSQPGVFTRTAVLWTDCETRRKIQFHVGSRVE